MAAPQAHQPHELSNPRYLWCVIVAKSHESFVINCNILTTAMNTPGLNNDTVHKMYMDVSAAWDSVKYCDRGCSCAFNRDTRRQRIESCHWYMNDAIRRHNMAMAP
jgi:hypothetical protein